MNRESYDGEDGMKTLNTGRTLSVAGIFMSDFTLVFDGKGWVMGWVVRNFPITHLIAHR